MVNSIYLTQAISDCEQALKNSAQETEQWQQACRNLGNLLQGLGRFDEAIQWHSLALESQPNKVAIYSYLGQLHVREQNWQNAIASLKNVLEYQPNSVQAHSSLAQIHGHLGEKDTEINYWYDAINLNPNLLNAQGYHKLGRVLQSQGRLNEAVVCYQRAKERGDQDSLASEYHLAEIWLQQGKLEEAAVYLQAILKQDPTNAQAHHKLGIIYLQQNCYEDAIIAFRKTIKLNPEFPWAYRDLVRTFIKLKKWDEAIATCHAIINLVQEFPWVYVHLGNALREKGQLAEAANSFQKACVLKGWQECQTNNYYFIRDYFSHRIATWEPCLQPLINCPEIKILLIGKESGMCACWLLDKVLTHPSAKLTCIQAQPEPDLTNNLAKTKAQEQVTQLVGDIHQLLDSLTPNTYDVVILQDQCKLATRAQQNASWAWKLAKIGGLIIFNDYGWRNSTNLEQNPQLGIDRFLESIPDRWDIVRQVPQAHQFIIQKQSKS